MCLDCFIVNKYRIGLYVNVKHTFLPTYREGALPLWFGVSDVAIRVNPSDAEPRTDIVRVMDTLFTNRSTEGILKILSISVRTERMICDFHSVDSEPIGENSLSFTNDKFLNKVDEAMVRKTSKIRDKPNIMLMEWFREHTRTYSKTIRKNKIPFKCFHIDPVLLKNKIYIYTIGWYIFIYHPMKRQYIILF